MRPLEAESGSAFCMCARARAFVQFPVSSLSQRPDETASWLGSRAGRCAGGWMPGAVRLMHGHKRQLEEHRQPPWVHRRCACTIPLVDVGCADLDRGLRGPLQERSVKRDSMPEFVGGGPAWQRCRCRHAGGGRSPAQCESSRDLRRRPRPKQGAAFHHTHVVRFTLFSALALATRSGARRFAVHCAPLRRSAADLRCASRGTPLPHAPLRWRRGRPEPCARAARRRLLRAACVQTGLDGLDSVLRTRSAGGRGRRPTGPGETETETDKDRGERHSSLCQADRAAATPRSLSLSLWSAGMQGSPVHIGERAGGPCAARKQPPAANGLL